MRRKSPSFITPHTGGAYRYNKAIPVCLRPVLGKTAFVRYIRAMPRCEAEQQARVWACEDIATIQNLLKLRADGQLTPEKITTKIVEFIGGKSVEQLAQIKDQRVFAGALTATIRTQAIMNKRVGFDGLFAEWVRIKEPKAPRNIEYTTGLLKKHFGENTNARLITRQQMGEWRDWLMKHHTPVAVKNHLAAASALYASCVREPSSAFMGIANPVAGIKMLGKLPTKTRGADKVFNSQQLRHMLAMMEATQFGTKRAEAIRVLIRALIFLGARPNEIACLQGGDVYVEEGVRVVRISENDARTGSKSAFKSVKNGESGRVVPLPPAIAEEFFEYARRFRDDEFVFSAFPWHPIHGRISWLSGKLPLFLKNQCGMTDKNKKLTLKSFRDTWIHYARIAGVPKDVRNAITGHSQGDVEGQHYGGYDLRMLADWMAKVRPLG